MLSKEYIVKFVGTFANKKIDYYLTGLRDNGLSIHPIISSLDADYAYRFKTMHEAKKMAMKAAGDYSDVLHWEVIAVKKKKKQIE